jgi:hypothetical protein
MAFVRHEDIGRLADVLVETLQRVCKKCSGIIRSDTPDRVVITSGATHD